MSGSGPQDEYLAPQQQEMHEQVAERRESAARKLAVERSRLLKDWLAGGVTEQEFAEAWPEIRAQLGQFRLMEVGDKARNRSLSPFRKPS